MKVNVHPKWYEEAMVTCACGNTFTVGATKPEIRVEICSRCNPFFTGEQRFTDTKGKIQKFQESQAKAKIQAPILAKKKAKKEHRVEEDKSPKSLKEMLMGA